MSVSVCVCVFVCPRSYLRNYTSDLHQIFVHVIYGRGSVVLLRRSDMLCTSGFMDDVMFAHKPRLLDVAAQLKRSAHAALSLAISCAVILVAGQRTHGTTFLPHEVSSQAAAAGAESAVYDCSVVVVYISQWLFCACACGGVRAAERDRQTDSCLPAWSPGWRGARSDATSLAAAQ